MKKIFLFLSTERSNFAANSALEECLKLSEDSNFCRKVIGNIRVESIKLKKSAIGNDDSSNIWQDIEIEHSQHEWKLSSNQEATDEKFDDSEAQSDKEFRFNDFFKLSEFLHKYADENCELGKDILQIIWCVHSYAPCPSEVVEFFGALKRLHIWHNASITIVTQDSSTVKEWNGLFPMQVVDSCLPIVKTGFSTCWKGSLSVLFEGKGEEFFPHIVISAESSNFMDHMESSFVLPVAEVFGEIDISTIPWTCIKNIHSISVPADVLGQQRDCIRKVLKLASQTTGIGTLIRIRHSRNPPNVSNLKSLSTETWKQNITDGKFNLKPSLRFDTTHQCTVLMILNEGRMEDKVFAISLQGANECGEEITKMIQEESLKLKPQMNCSEKEKIYSLMRETELISNVHVAALSHLLRNLPKKLRKMISKKTDVDKLSPDMKGSWEKICNEEIAKVILTKPGHESKYLDIVQSPHTVAVSPEILRPMENWPEYIALAEMDLDTKSALKRSSSSDLLHGLLPPISKPKEMLMDDTDILRVFDKSGQASKEVLGNMTKYDKRGVSYFKGWGKRGNDIPWQKALRSNVHGICYNSTEDKERFEFASNRTRDQHIINETASMCSSFKNREIRLRRKSGLLKRLAPLSDSDTFSDVTSIRTVSTVPVIPENRVLSSSSIMTEAKTSKRQSREPGRKDLSAILKETQRKRKSLEMLDPNADLHSFNSVNQDAPLRRSPRKHMSKGLKPSDLLRPNFENRSNRNKADARGQSSRHNPKPADLSDLHKMKLRNAIKTVLDSEDVSMKDPLFKQCFQKLFAVCRPFALDVIGLGSTSRNMEKIAQSHVKQVIEFEKLKRRKR